MCDFFSWERDDDDREEAHGALKDAMTHQFNRKYGTDADNLASWQALCIVLKIFPIPVALDACRNVSDSNVVPFENQTELMEAHKRRELNRHTSISSIWLIHVASGSGCSTPFKTLAPTRKKRENISQRKTPTLVECSSSSCVRFLTRQTWLGPVGRELGMDGAEGTLEDEYEWL
jgi:hypothetical protein